MWRIFPRMLLMASLLVTGCQEPDDPYADSIPDIPPGRSASNADGGEAIYPPAPSGER